MTNDGAMRGTAIRQLVLACLMWGVSFPVAKALEKVHAQAVPGVDSWFSAGATMFVRFSISAVIIGLMLA